MEPIISPQFLHNPKAVVSRVGYGDDTGILAVFSDEYIRNEYKSEATGTTVLDHKIQVFLEYPGNNQFNFKAQFSPEEADRGNEWTHRFPRQWQAFKAQKAQIPEGTPLEVWPPLDKGRVLGLKAINIHTVEQLGALTDATGPNIGLDWRKLRDMAKAFLNPEFKASELAKVQKENEDLRSRLDAMEKNMQNLSQVQNLSSVPLNEAPKRRGRKPKVVTEEPLPPVA